MQKLFLAFALSALLLCGCDDYDDSALRGDLNDLENRVAKLEQLCNQMNTNIASLQSILTAVQNYDYVTGVTPILQDGKEVGYTILFSKSNPITIYHGQKGADGSTPEIGVKQDTDGIYYWTLNGDWLTDDKGQKIIAEGVKGEPGEAGKPGEAGAAGTTPTFQIVDGYWQVSYDGGQSWTQLGKATGESGDSVFSGIDYQSDPNYVLFTLADGTQIKLPTWSAFEALQTLCNQTNTNLNALQAIVEAIEQNDYITSVDPLTENGLVVGYTIKFAKSNPIVIYNGKDGVSGTTPEIGIKQDTDGLYYWTLNGEFIEVDGQKIRAQGKDGANGSDGNNGTTPKLKIEEGYWWISYNDGADWTKLDKATGEDGKDGDSIKITQDENNVYIELPDGTTITISKRGNSSGDGQHNSEDFIIFESIITKNICIRNWDTNHDGELSYAEALAVTTLGDAFKNESGDFTFDELQFFSNLTEINPSAFSSSGIRKVTLPSNITTIGNSAFNQSKIATITIPNSVTTIERSAFKGTTNLYKIDFEKDSQLSELGEEAFRGSALHYICIPAKITILKERTFEDCVNLKEISFAEGSLLSNIATYCFSQTGEFIEKIDMSNCKYLLRIGEYAFCYPRSFFKMENLVSFKIGTVEPPACTTNTFNGIPANAILYVPAESIEKYREHSYWSKFKNIVALEE